MSKKAFLMTGSALALCAIAMSAEGLGSGGGDGAAVDRPNTIRGAAKALDPSNDADWTDSGLPAMDRMKELTGLDDLKRQEVGEALPGYTRVSSSSAPSDLSTVGAGNGGDAGPTSLETAIERTSPNLDPSDNPNVGKETLGPYEGQAHTADQRERLAEEHAADLWTEGREPVDLAKMIKDPVFLIEAAMSAMNADDRYRKNGELQAFMRHYSIAQTNIKAHQARLDQRYHDAKKAEAEREKSAG